MPMHFHGHIPHACAEQSIALLDRRTRLSVRFLEKLMGLLPELELLALISEAIGNCISGTYQLFSG